MNTDFNHEREAMRRARHIRFDGTITMGNLLTMLGMIATVLALWRNMETRIVIIEERIQVQTKSLERIVDQVERLAQAQWTSRNNPN